MSEPTEHAIQGKRWFRVPETLLDIAVDIDGDVKIKTRWADLERIRVDVAEPGRTCSQHKRWVGRRQVNDPCWPHCWASDEVRADIASRLNGEPSVSLSDG